MPCQYGQFPVNTKHLYHIYTVLDHGDTISTVGPATLDRRCINVIQMFCVCWDVMPGELKQTRIDKMTLLFNCLMSTLPGYLSGEVFEFTNKQAGNCD